MPWKRFAFCACLLILASCGSKDQNDASPPVETTIQFLIGANGIIDKAIHDKRLTEICFEKQTPVDVTISEAESAFQFKAGRYYGYHFNVKIGAEFSFGDAAIFVDHPLPVAGQFRLSDFRYVGRVKLSGSAPDRASGGTYTMHGSPYRMFSATLDSKWTGKIDNHASPEPNSPLEKDQSSKPPSSSRPNP